MERMMDGMNGGMETTSMPEMGGFDGGGAVEPSRPKRPSRPKAAGKRKPQAKAKARKTAISSVHGERRSSSSSARACASSPWPAVASTSSV